MLDLPSVMHRLAQTRPIFHSEADFQHALAWQLQAEHPDAKVRLEYRPFPDEKMYIDIWCQLDGYATAIELKYPTRQLSISAGDERFVLVNHSAQDITRYLFVKDVARLERVIAHRPNTRAAAIMLTNEPLYWKKPYGTVSTIDAAFRIHDGRTLSGCCSWATTAGKGTTDGKESPLDLRGTYLLNWQDYSSVDEPSGTSRFVIIEPLPVAHASF